MRGRGHYLSRIRGDCGRAHARVVSAALILLLTTGAGCSGLPRSETRGRAEAMKNVAANYNQVRLRMRALVYPMCGELEQAADEIIAGTTDRSVQRAALLWKIEGMPALREALFQPDPLTAALDTWVLCFQMADYFETGPGQKALGESSPRAVEACRRMEEDFARLADSMAVSGDASKVRAFARKWALEHRIHNSISGRETALRRVVEQDIAETFSVREAATEVTTTMDDLNRKLSIYSDQLFRQARWEAELLRSDLLEGLSADQAIPLAERAVKSAERAATSAERAVATAERLAPVIERAVDVVQEGPKLIASERESVLQAFHSEVKRTIETVQAERLATLMQFQEVIGAERKPLVRDLDQLRSNAIDETLLDDTNGATRGGRPGGDGTGGAAFAISGPPGFFSRYHDRNAPRERGEAATKTMIQNLQEDAA